MARVKVENLTKTFGETIAVRNLNLEIRDKEFLVLLGPSGCGKTTTLRIVAGLETSDSGTVYIDDKDVTELDPGERDVAMVFQSYALYPHMTVYDNMAFPLKYGVRKYPKKEIDRKVREAAALLRIDKLLHRKPKQLSGGEAQRVALGRAIVREPEVFLMDEPLSNLDAKLRVYMRAELKSLQKALGTTTIYVTHDQLEAMTMSDRIALMKEGSLEQLGSGDDLFYHPTSVFTAGFLGTPPMNFIDCTFVEKDGKAFLISDAFELDVSEWKETILKVASSPELILGIRPDDVGIDMERPQKFDIVSDVYVCEPAGSEVILDFRLGKLLFKVRTKPEMRCKPGDQVWLTFDRTRIHLFEKKTEKAIL